MRSAADRSTLRAAGGTGHDPAQRGAQRVIFPLLDPLRAIAAIAILVVHVAIFSDAFDDPIYGRLVAHLDIGVPFFFVLSAFLLYRPFVAARVSGQGRGSLGSYARRRFWRIAPAYWAALSIAAIVPGMAGAFSGNWWVYYGLLQNYPVYTRTGTCAVDGFRCALPPTWTLAIEVGFYAVLPLIVLTTARISRMGIRIGWLGPELAFFALLSVISVAIQGLTVDTDLKTWLFFSPLGRAWWFALGLALASASVAAARRSEPIAVVDWLRRHPGPPVALAALFYVGASEFMLEPGPSLNFRLGDRLPYLAEYVLFGLVAALCLLPIVFTPEAKNGLYRRLLGHRWLAWLGLISYGIFLWQFPVLIGLIDIDAASILPIPDFPALLLLTFVGTLVCAALSFYLLERPIMRRVRSGNWPLGLASRLRSDS